MCNLDSSILAMGDKYKKLEAERDALRAELAAAVNTAGEAIGTDPSLRNVACVEVLADAYRRAKAERDALREKVKALEEANRDRKWPEEEPPLTGRYFISIKTESGDCAWYTDTFYADRPKLGHTTRWGWLKEDGEFYWRPIDCPREEG